MKLLLWHCESLSYSDGRPSTRPLGIHELPPTPTSGAYGDVLLVFTTVESGDDADIAIRAASEIGRAIEMVGERPILLMPFAHLSNSLAKSGFARRTIDEIGRQLRQVNLKVDIASFGFHKEEFRLNYVAHGHVGSVAYREV